MEEEDESRGKTEESGEDRGDGPPDRDPALSPSAFILRAIQQAVGSSLQGDLPNDKGMRSTGPLRLLPFLWAFIFIFSEVS